MFAGDDVAGREVDRRCLPVWQFGLLDAVRLTSLLPLFKKEPVAVVT
jgi:hypothetical protein